MRSSASPPESRSRSPACGRRCPCECARHPTPPWVTAVPPETGLLPGNAYFRGVATRVEIEVCSWGPLGLIGYSRTRLARPPPHALDRATAARVEGADRHPAAERPAAGRSGGCGRRGRHHPERARVRARRSPAPGRLVGHRTHWQARDARELERPATHVVHLVVDLGAEPGEIAERVAGIAAWAGRQILASGAQLSLTAMAPMGRAPRW